MPTKLLLGGHLFWAKINPVKLGGITKKNMNPQSANQDSSQSTLSARMKQIFSLQKTAYANAPMPTLAQRKQQLGTLKSLLIAHKDDIASAISADFTTRSVDETMLAEIIPGIQSINYTLKRLHRWMKPAKRNVGLHFMPACAQVFYQPVGVVGIIVPYNYPLGMAVEPMVSAIAAGNRVMIKMSELTPRTAALMGDILSKGFKEDQIAVITGEADVAASFAKLPFDHLLFTGSTRIGKLVMREAAENLTPVTLELGGKSPAVIADDIPLADFVDRLCFAKSLNGGQTCVAPDYILLPRNKEEAFKQQFKNAFLKMYPDIAENTDYTSIINAHSYQRLLDLLSDAKMKGAKIEKIGNECIKDSSLRMPIHLVSDVTDAMHIMQQELFGPILPLVPYDNIEEALAYVKQRPRPLALYLFTYNKELQDRVINNTHSGSMCINDAVLQVGIDDLPFGGTGQSGMGHYHGHEGFLTMSKAKSIMRKGRLNSMKFIYPPYGGIIHAWLMKWLLR